MNKKTVNEILKRLDEHYTTELKCYLNHDSAWQLLIATILSAQCTDERVNKVTRDLFVKYPTLKAFADANLSELEDDIRPVGFNVMKAKNIKACAARIVRDYDGVVPSDIDELVKLEGVGRLTANVIRGNVYGEPSIVVDTHAKRISGLLGFTKETDPVKIEYELMKILPKEHWIRYNIQIITHGKYMYSKTSQV